MLFFWCANITGPINDKKIDTIARKIVVNNKFTK
ncbi:DUF4765 family protein, partial [Salmonella enterica]